MFVLVLLQVHGCELNSSSSQGICNMSASNSKSFGHLNDERESNKVNENVAGVSRDDAQERGIENNGERNAEKAAKVVEKSRRISGSRRSDVSDEGSAQAQKADKKKKQNNTAKNSSKEDSNRPRVNTNDDDGAASQKIRDKAFLQSMEVAERGYVTRIRPESSGDHPTLSQYQVRPGLEEKFKALTVKEMIHTVLNDELGGKVYSEEEAKIWSHSIANTIRMKVKEMGFPRYKFVVQCVLGEEHGAGVKIGSRCLWDADTDNYASDTFLNETIFCMTAVYAIYFY